MDYKKIYDDLCRSRKHRGTKKEEGYEVHHIILRCEGGTDEESNLVKFTYREHFIAHLLLAKAYPYKINYRLATVYFLRKPEVVGGRTYENLKKRIEDFKRYQKYLHWGNTHKGRIKISSLYDKTSENLTFHRKHINKAKSLIKSLDIKFTDNNLRIHLEVFKLLLLIRGLGYKGAYGWQSLNNRPSSPQLKPKYAFNKLKSNFINLGVIDLNGDFVESGNPLDNFEYVNSDLKKVLKSDIDRRLGIVGLLFKWNNTYKTKTITTYKQGDKIVLEPVTPFLPADFKYSLEIFKPISYRKAKEIIEYLLYYEGFTKEY
ncbi:homing endonuclease [Pseudoalteromonas phage H101]|uniref:Homing endonuclease n=1 Tax=Pseudoalteromonas phage H101 TaxID=1654919 RepID=A0A0H4IN44_9CAUD|nr:homing endonuclease [Pseudoalteromonas phage H101]AKO60969.1 homing endonuclease [Pseudoalteromonas phage H101]